MSNSGMREITLEAVSQQLRISLSPREFQSLSLKIDVLTDNVVIQVKRNLMAEKRQDIVEVKFTHSYPDGWWQSFKHELFPKFLLDRFPVKMKVVEEKKTVEVNRMFGFPEAYVAYNPNLSKFVVYDNHKIN